MSDTEDKTTFEELLKNTPEQKAEAHKVERAYHLISQGYWSDADALFDEVLADDPKTAKRSWENSSFHAGAGYPVA